MSDDVPISREAFDALRSRVADLEARLDRGETGVDGTLDHRDATVLGSLEEGEVVTGPDLVNSYRRHTDVVDSSTAKQRAKALTQKPMFEIASADGRLRWRFVGGEGEI